MPPTDPDANQHAGEPGAATPLPGPVIAIGGAEDKLNDRAILSTFLLLAGGERAHLAIIPTASSIESAGQRYKALFMDLGCPSAEVVPMSSREDAQGEIDLGPLEHATGIFITGGNQVRLSATIGGTPAERVIKARHRAGAVVAGTSAGASILSAHMVALGASGQSPRLRMVQMVAGFGLVEGVIIDQHFRQRDRIGRLLALVAANPSLLGIGIDEDTAALFEPSGIVQVLGRNSVTIVDGEHMRSDVAEIKGHGSISVADARLHVLTAGRRFDLLGRHTVDW